MTDFKFIYKRPTAKNHGHIEVHYKGINIGYLMLDRSKYRTVGQNYTFTNSMRGIQPLNATGKAAMMVKLKNLEFILK
jgi:hypothetical protein